MRTTSAAMVVLVLAVLLGSCSRGPSLQEYASSVERLVLEMNTTLTAIEETRAETPRSLEAEKAYFASRVEARRTFMTRFENLELPPGVEDMQAQAVAVMQRLTAAEESIAEQAAAATTFADLEALATSEELREFLAADEAAQELCLAAQAEFDATQDSALAAGIPWVPVEIREVVRVALDCDPNGGD